MDKLSKQQSKLDKLYYKKMDWNTVFKYLLKILMLYMIKFRLIFKINKLILLIDTHNNYFNIFSKLKKMQTQYFY